MAGNSGADMENTGHYIISAKRYNRGLILKLISTGQCRSRIELAQATGLAKMTVSNIIGEYIKSGIIEEKEEEKTDSCGRNPVLLTFAPTAPHVIGLLIFRDYVEAVLCDMNLNIGVASIGPVVFDHDNNCAALAETENCIQNFCSIWKNMSGIISMDRGFISLIRITDRLELSGLENQTFTMPRNRVLFR
jgi:hypothetical protein